MRRNMSRLVLLLVVAAGIAAGRAGTLEPPGPVSPTMQSLDQIKGGWHRIIISGPRWQVVMSGAGVLDLETGLVWEKAPASTKWDWVDATEHCINLKLGGRMGWRLPKIEELLSLANIDPGATEPFIPAGHPFTDVVTSSWSLNGVPNTSGGTAMSYIGSFGNPAPGAGDAPKSTLVPAWCVRGGTGYDYIGQ